MCLLRAISSEMTTVIRSIGGESLSDTLSLITCSRVFYESYRLGMLDYVDLGGLMTMFDHEIFSLPMFFFGFPILGSLVITGLLALPW